MLRIIEDLTGDWRRLDARIEGLSSEIETLARQDKACERLMTVPGIGPLISSAMVAAIGTGNVFSKGRDFGAASRLPPAAQCSLSALRFVRYPPRPVSYFKDCHGGG
ncbi:transposase [Bradyrhizobium sp. LM2.7]